jgi:hypothetical protein
LLKHFVGRLLSRHSNESLHEQNATIAFLLTRLYYHGASTRESFHVGDSEVTRYVLSSAQDPLWEDRQGERSGYREPDITTALRHPTIEPGEHTPI